MEEDDRRGAGSLQGASGLPEREKLREAVAAVLGRLDSAADLHACLQAVGYIPPPAVALVAERTGRAPDEVFDRVRRSRVLDFRPWVGHRVAICRGARCSSKGARHLVEQARSQLGVDFFGTTSGGAVRLEPFDCFDRCAGGPNVRIDGEIHGRLDAPSLRTLLDTLLDTAPDTPPGTPPGTSLEG